MTNLIALINDKRLSVAQSSLEKKVALSVLFAVLLGVASQIKIYLAFTPIPMNLGTFAICASAITLGGKWSLISLVVYFVFAALGLPMTAQGGLLGATTGYLVGYAICAFVLGKYTENRRESFIKSSLVLFIAQVGIIHVAGMIGMYFWSMTTEHTFTLTEVIMKGSVPFLLGDSLKALVLSGIMARIVKK